MSTPGANAVVSTQLPASPAAVTDAAAYAVTDVATDGAAYAVTDVATDGAAYAVTDTVTDAVTDTGTDAATDAATAAACAVRQRGRWMAILLVAGLLPLGACSIEPWVKPYDRERLADPIMKPARDTLAEKHHEHIYDVREGARGATGVQGGGCGCN